jgi:hypothetical protein
MGTGDRFGSVRLALGRAQWRMRLHASQPLVSILIPTWNRGELLTARTLPSLLRQTYGNWEAVVVGDACTDDTAERIAALGDPRVRFTNLKERGAYPSDPLHRWMVAGTAPANRALDLAKGEWLGGLDDDEVFTDDHIEVLLRLAGQTQAEFVYGAGDWQRSPTEWLRIGKPPLQAENLTHSAFLYRSYLRFLKYDVSAWKEGIGGDAQLWRRMARLAVRYAFIDRVVCQSPLRPGEDLAGQRAAERRSQEYRAGSGTPPR